MVILFQFVPNADIVPSPPLAQPVGICLPRGHHFAADTYEWGRLAIGFMAAESGVNGLSTTLLWTQAVKREKIWSDLITESQQQKKTCICDFCQQSVIWEGFINDSIFSQTYRFALKLLDYIRSSLSGKGSGFLSALLHFPVHMPPSRSEKRVTLPLLAGPGKCAPLWQMNDVKQTYLYSFRAEEEENPSVTDVMGTAMCERACI